MIDHQTMFEVVDDAGVTIGNVDLKQMRDDLSNYARLVEGLKQEVQQLRGQLQRNSSQLKLLETRLVRR